MKQDLDQLMQERGLSAIVVAGKLNGNPALSYMINGAKVVYGRAIKKKGSEPILVSAPIDREEAALSGLEVLTTSDFHYGQILQSSPDEVSAQVELFRQIFEKLGIQGKVGFYGMLDQGSAWLLLNAIQEKIEGIEVYGEPDITLIDMARATKDKIEADRIREVGKKTLLLMDHMLDFLRAHKVKDETLVRADGSVLTIGRAHQEISTFMATQGIDVPEGVIFSMGRDAGVPHNKGTFNQPITLGKSIIFDVGTHEMDGGYYFDMTRSFCLGYAPAEVQKAYDDVRTCMESILSAYEVGAPVQRFMNMAYDIFESQGHPTMRSNPQSDSGFVHGLGHGIGLAIHEEPFFTTQPSNPQVLRPGQIFTCEPGLYYPEKGFGVRIEDVIWIDANGSIHNMTNYPKELVVKM